MMEAGALFGFPRLAVAVDPEPVFGTVYSKHSHTTYYNFLLGFGTRMTLENPCFYPLHPSDELMII